MAQRALAVLVDLVGLVDPLDLEVLVALSVLVVPMVLADLAGPAALVDHLHLEYQELFMGLVGLVAL